MTKPDHSKTINQLIFIALLVVCSAFGLFIILNWKYISNPFLIPNYRGNSIFEYQEDLAKFRYWGFFYPWNVLGFLIYLQTFMVTYFLIKKNLNFSTLQWIIIIFSLIFIYTSPEILDFLSNTIGFNPYNYIDLNLHRTISNVLMILVVILFFVSIWMIFLKSFRHYRKFLAITLFTAIMNIIFIFAFMELFFD